MKTLIFKDEIKDRNIPVKVIDDVIEANYDSMDELVERFKEPGEIPLIILGVFRGASMLYRIKTPLIKVSADAHPIYHDVKSAREGYLHRFNGPELVAQLAHKGDSQIIHYEDGSCSNYPNEEAESWGVVFNGYAVILPKDIPHGKCPYPRYFIAGEDDCKRQLAEWGIDDIGKKTDIFGQVVGHVKGLL